MKTKTVDAYDWQEDVEPILRANLNELLVAKGIQPLEDLHGGQFYENKWQRVEGHNDYRNYWHAYIELWGEGLRNDSYQCVHFNDPDDDEEWSWYKEHLREWANHPYRSYKHVDPNWTDDLVDAMRKVVKEHFPHDEQVVFWWCW